MKRARFLLVLLVVVLASGLSACGGGSSGTSSTTSAPETTTAVSPPAESKESTGAGSRPEGGRTRAAKKQAKNEEPAFKPKAHHDSGGGSSQFRTKGGDNSVQEYGDEGSGREFEEAAAVLHEFLDARAAGALGAACKRLAPAVVEELAPQLGSSSGGRSPTCAEVLAGLSAGVPASALREAAIADVGALRAKGSAGFLLFRGAGGKKYFMPMQRTDGEWKVAAIAASAVG